MKPDGQGTVAALIGILVVALSSPPAPAERAMALVLNPSGGGDHLGLLNNGQASPGGFDLLVSVIQSRVRPRATVLLEWTLAGKPPLRHYRGWTVWQEAGELAWRRLTPAEVRIHPGLNPDHPFGNDPDTRFDP